VLAETGHAYPMGIAFGPDGDLYVCDNQNWPTGNGQAGSAGQFLTAQAWASADQWL